MSVRDISRDLLSEVPTRHRRATMKQDVSFGFVADEDSEYTKVGDKMRPKSRSLSSLPLPLLPFYLRFPFLCPGPYPIPELTFPCSLSPPSSFQCPLHVSLFPSPLYGWAASAPADYAFRDLPRSF